jgi:aminoglycoside 2'-N-acetyltransferase I
VTGLPPSTRVEILSTEELAADLRHAICAVCVAANDHEDFWNLFTYIPSGGRHAVGYAGDEVVSHAVVNTRWVQPGELPILRTAYFDAVATSPDHQGRGHGSAVVTRLGDALPDFEIACLQTDVADFYTRLGWELWRGPLAGRTDDGLIPTPDQRGVMVRRLAATPAIDLDARLTIEPQPHRIWE